MISPGAEYVVSLGGEGLPHGESDRFFQIATPPLCVSGSARLPLGESEDLPRGGKTPLAGGILVSLVGEGLPLWV